MTNVPYNFNIPDADNDPSDDQPKMKVNTNAINTLFEVNHYGFKNDFGGLHQKVTFPANIDSVPHIDPSSEIFTATGTQSTKSEAFYRNENGTFPISLVKACAAIEMRQTSGKATTTNDFNVVDVDVVVLGINATYTVNLTPGVVIGTDVLIFANRSGSTSSNNIGWTFTANTLTISTLKTLGLNLNFMVCQI